MNLQANGFKGLEETFTNNEIQNLANLSTNHSLFSLNSSWKNKFRFKGFRFKFKGSNFNLAHKQNMNNQEKKNLCCWMKLVGVV
jgi:hypothetical protein